MTTALLTLASLIAAPFLWFADVANIGTLYDRVSVIEQVPTLGADANPVAGKKYYLSGGGISSSATTLTLTSFKTPVSNYNLSMTDFGEIGYLTIEPGSETRQEFVSFTGITQNGDGTATLSGLTRGLSPISPYTASTTLQKAHAGGSVVVASNPPQLYNLFSRKDSDETITGQWTFSTFPITPSNSTSSETRVGIVELATGAEIAASTATSTSPGGPLVIPAKLATSTFNSATAANVIPVTGSNGKLNSLFIATSSLFAYTLPTSTAATSSVLAIDGSNKSYWVQPDKVLLVSTTTTAAMQLASTTFPGGYENLWIEIDNPTNISTANGYILRFNNDAGSNYGFRVVENSPSESTYGLSANSFAGLTTNTSTTSAAYFKIEVHNPTSTAKMLTWQGAMHSTAAGSPALVQGTAKWNNTTDQITSFQFSPLSQNVPIGTRIRVWGSGR